MRVLQVGMGGWGRNWAIEVLPQVADVELVGCVDAVAESLILAQEQGIVAVEDCYDSLETALEAAAPDAVLVTTDLSGHVPVAREALEAGKHVLVEKPFAPSLVAATELVELAAARDLNLMVSQNYRFFPAVRAVQEIVRSGDLGALHTVNIDFRRFSAVGRKGRSPHHLLAEPLLSDMAIHHFDLLRAVLGREPRDVFCRTWNPPWSWFAGPPEGTAVISFEDDLTVSYRGSWLSPGPATPWAGEWRMEFERGEVAWTSRGDRSDGIQGEKVIVRPLGRPEQLVRLPTTGPADRAGSLTEFAAAIGAGRVPESSGHDNLGSLALMHAAIAAAASSGPLTVEGVAHR